MNCYKIEVLPAARKFLRKLPEKIRRKIQSLIDSLVTEPRPPDCVKLQEDKRFYRIRSGEYRIIYKVEDDILLVVIVRIDIRGQVYKAIKKLRK